MRLLENNLLTSEVNLWQNNGINICDAPGDQLNIDIINYGNKGSIIVWEDKRISTPAIYAQKIDLSGEIQWETNGTIICNIGEPQVNPRIIGDDAGGAIIVWNSQRNGSYDIYAQRINSSGHRLWDANGTMICNATDYQRFPKIVSDKMGGAIITWADNREGHNALYAQCINSTGQVQWEENGVLICNETIDFNEIQIVAGSKNDAIIYWKDERWDGSSLYAQRITSDGKVNWTNDGIIICNATGMQYLIQSVSDNNGGAIFTWTDGRKTDLDIYAQKVNSSGITQWENNGTVICNASQNQLMARIISDNNDGAVILWRDTRVEDSDVYIQRINSDGQDLWMENGIGICTSPDLQQYSKMIMDDSDDIIIAWCDWPGSGDLRNIYVQKINLDGEIQWKPNGFAVTYFEDEIKAFEPELVSDGNGGAIIIWYDDRNGDNNIYAQRVIPSGDQVGDPFNPIVFMVIIICIIAIASIVSTFIILKYRSTNKNSNLFPRRISRGKKSFNFKKNQMQPPQHHKLKQTKGNLNITQEKMSTHANTDELQKIENEMTIDSNKLMCVVHRGEIVGSMFACPHCQTIYCQKCARALKDKGEKCWSCGNDLFHDS